MTTMVFSRKSSPAQGKEDPRNVLSPLLPIWQQASSAVVSFEKICQRSDWHTKTVLQNTADMSMNNAITVTIRQNTQLPLTQDRIS